MQQVNQATQQALDKMKKIIPSPTSPLGRWLHHPRLRQIFDVGVILHHDMIRCDLFKHASAMAYVTLFSIIPSLAAVFALLSLFKPLLGADSGLFNTFRDYILQNLAAGTGGDQVVGYLEKFLSNLDMKKIGLTGFAGLLVTLIMLLKQVEGALNRIWLVHTHRNQVRRFLYFWTFLTLGGFLLSLSVGIVSGFNVDNLLHLNKATSVGRSFFPTLTPWLAGFMFFMLLYKFVPNCSVTLKEAAVGALVAVVLFNLAADAYSQMAKTMFNQKYQAIYGALAALPLFLTWLYVCWIITLLGAVFSWRTQQGFSTREDLDAEVTAQTPTEHMRNIHVRGLVPIFSLFAIYDHFQRGNGKGLDGLQLTTMLNLPVHWISESLESLLANELIKAASSMSSTEDEDLMKREFLPSYPIHLLSVEKIMKGLVLPTWDWFSEWEQQLPFDTRQLLHRLANLRHEDYASTNLSAVLSAVSTPSRS